MFDSPQSPAPRRCGPPTTQTQDPMAKIVPPRLPWPTLLCPTPTPWADRTFLAPWGGGATRWGDKNFISGRNRFGGKGWVFEEIVVDVFSPPPPKKRFGINPSHQPSTSGPQLHDQGRRGRGTGGGVRAPTSGGLETPPPDPLNGFAEIRRKLILVSLNQWAVGDYWGYRRTPGYPRGTPDRNPVLNQQVGTVCINLVGRGDRRGGRVWHHLDQILALTRSNPPATLNPTKGAKINLMP